MTHRSRRCHFAHHHPACTCQRYQKRDDLMGLAESIQRWSVSHSKSALLGLPASAVAATLSMGCHGATRDESTVGSTRYRSYQVLPDRRPGASTGYYENVGTAPEEFEDSERPARLSAASDDCAEQPAVWYASCQTPSQAPGQAQGSTQEVQRRRFDESATAPVAAYTQPGLATHRVQQHTSHGYVDGPAAGLGSVTQVESSQ